MLQYMTNDVMSCPQTTPCKISYKQIYFNDVTYLTRNKNILVDYNETIS